MAIIIYLNCLPPLMEYSLSILGYSGNLKESKGLVKDILASGIKYLHIDIMRESFVGRHVFTLEEIAEVCTWHRPLDIHIMSRQPEEVMQTIYRIPVEFRGESFVTVPLEAYRSEGYFSYDRLAKSLQDLRRNDFRSGLSVEPDTDVSHLMPFMNSVDLVLVMGVKSGAGGQEFIDGALYKISVARECDKTVSVDGGINARTIHLVRDSGTDIAVVGSYITSSDEPIKKAKSLPYLVT
jgi:ribulose-phosphate 3-epimerase